MTSNAAISSGIRRAAATARGRTQAMPRAWRSIRGRDIAALLAGSVLLIFAMWLRHHGTGVLDDPWASIGQVTALAGTWAALAGVLFASRAPWLDQVVGTDRLRVIHRWTGFASVWLLAIHGATSLFAFAGDSILAMPGEVLSLVLTVPGMLGAIVSMALFGLVAFTSIRAARRRLSYESWHGIHLYVYLAVAFGFLHQLTIGTDFAGDPLARVVWIAIYVVAFAPLIAYRVVEPVVRSLRHAYRVERVEDEGPGVFSLYVGGRDLDRLPVRSGQYFVIRVLGRGWWRGHPYSLSAAPDGRNLRFTIKAFGEGSFSYRELRPGTRLLLEGPYGVLHGGRRSRPRLLFIAGGIGITPVRALVQSLPYRPGEADLVYRAPTADDLVLRAEIDALSARRGLGVHYVTGRRGSRGVGPDPFGPAALAALAPDIAWRDVYVCGPTKMMAHVVASLRELGLASSQIHLERFD
jgi:predicted ferric reductase